MNLVNTLLQAVDRWPNHTAMVEKSNRLSFQELCDGSLKLGSLFKERNIARGDYVLVLQPMSIELYLVLIGLWSIGAVPLFFDPSAGKEFISQCCSIIRPRALVASNKALLLCLYSKDIRDLPFKIGTQTNGIFPSVRQAAGLQPTTIVDVEDDFPALVTFTSGSTGRPKAAVRTHRFLLKQYEILTQNLHYYAGQIDLATLPVFTLANIAAGVTTVIPDTDLRKVGSIDARTIVGQIRRHGVTRMAASPSFIRCIVDHCHQAGLKLETLTDVNTGGGPVFPRLLAAIREVMPNSRLAAVYGSTEAEPIAEISFDDISTEDVALMSGGKGLLAGKPVEQIDCRVIRAEWGKPLGTLSVSEFDGISLGQQVGEIVVCGDHVLKSYYNNVGDAENKFDAAGRRWHRTGDMGCFDEHGRLWLVGRASAKISDEKGDLYPFCVECAADTIFGIERSALVQFNGLRVLVLENREREQLPEIKAKLDWARLDQVHFTAKIPVDKRHNAKIDYPALLKLLKRELH